MDIGSAFTYVFDDQDWLKKIGIGGVASLLGIIIVPIFLIQGYRLQTLKNVRDGQERPLPEWDDLGTLIVKGLMVVGIGVVYYIPALIFLCASFGTRLASANANPDVSGTMDTVAFCLGCLEVILGLLAGVIFPAALIRYAQYDTFGSAFQFGEIFSFISGNTGDYIIAVILSWVANLIALVGIILCFIGVAFTAFWSVLVSANLYGQLARKAASST